jgi:uncharacterized metal-binding protein
MPSGRTHDRLTLWTLPAIAGLSLALTHSSRLTLIVCVGFLFSGLMLGPDLDIHSVQFKRWGWFRWIWLPYRHSIRHRSPLSHGPITGTVIRVVYLVAWLGLIAVISLSLTNEIWQLGWTWRDMGGFIGRLLRQHVTDWLALVIGLEIGALSHYATDWGFSTYKQFSKKGIKAFRPQPSKKRKRRSSRK